MNHRTGRLKARDFDPSQDQPAPTFFIGPIEHTSDFGVLDTGRTFHAPAPQRDMWEDERRASWLVWAYFAAFFGVLLISHLIARAQS